VAVLARKLCSGFTRRRRTHRASLDHFCTKRDNARAFYRVRIFRQKNRGADFCDARRVGNSGAVITGTRGNNSSHRALRRSGEQSVQRSARLEPQSVDRFQFLNGHAPLSVARVILPTRDAWAENIATTIRVCVRLPSRSESSRRLHSSDGLVGKLNALENSIPLSLCGTAL